MKKTLLILVLAASFLTAKSQNKVTYTVKENVAEYFLNGESVMKLEKGEITYLDESLSNLRTTIQQCVDQKWKNCLHNNWCDCIWDDVNYSACNFAFYAECIKESKGEVLQN